ncbi:MAG: CRISPR system precrRNA processing endoribonuclease RAMP protein Cas6 [Desulfobacterales bacterium]|nr:CRISPR system precrRNA processing endoribonuclease RAMP protein Cas6 [Desulfobacterales bacterium]
MNFEKMLSPLLSLPVSRFHLRFAAEKNWKIYGMESSFRGRLGWRLKKNCCPFTDFSHKSCKTCELSDTCIYLFLFEPKLRRQGNSEKSNTVPRPFVFAFSCDKAGGDLNPGEFGTVTVSLFGSAIQYNTFFLEAAVFALSSFPLRLDAILADSPYQEGSVTNDAAYPLSRWAGLLPDPGTDSVTVKFLTPVRLTKKKSPVRDELSFIFLIRSVIRRLRDLKRAFNMDGNMGKTENEFFELAETVETTKAGLVWNRRKRYSVRQGQDIFMNGLEGEISFKGPVCIFYPLLKSAEFVHIGKGTSGGNGKIAVV